MIAILGGGISGLALARKLALRGHRVVVYEAKPVLGGWVDSERVSLPGEGEHKTVLFERGPHSLRPRSQGNGLRIVELLCELGLDKQALLSQGSDRFIYHNNALVRLPQTLAQVFKNDLTRWIPFNLARDFFALPGAGAEDETIATFLGRKLGRDARPLYTAMVAGIFAGNADNLSVQSCFPQLMDAQRSGAGSLLRGMLLSSISGRKSKPTSKLLFDLATIHKLTRASSISFPDGMQTLVRALEQDCRKLGVEFKLANRVERLQYKNKHWRVNAGEEEKEREHYAHVVSTLQPRMLHSILHNDESESKTALLALARKIESVDVAVANLCYRVQDIPLLPRNSFGHLIGDAKLQNEHGCIGVLYDSSAFPAQQPSGHVVLSVMLGGAQARWIAKMHQEELVDLAKQALRHQLFITAQPLLASAVLHRDCIPQYQVGHSAARAALLDKARKEFGNSFLVLGTGVLGVGLADSVGGGLQALEEAGL